MAPIVDDDPLEGRPRAGMRGRERGRRALQATDLRPRRSLQTASGHGKIGRHVWHARRRAAVRAHRRRAGDPARSARDDRCPEWGGFRRAGIRGILCRLPARAPSGHLGSSNLFGLQPRAAAAWDKEDATGGPVLRVRGVPRRCHPATDTGLEEGALEDRLAPGTSVQPGGPVLYRAEECRRRPRDGTRRGGIPCGMRHPSRHCPHRRVRKRGAGLRPLRRPTIRRMVRRGRG